ncbi:MAG TPA: lysine--tRNA ligase [Pyrinomonadaceae bacterium]|jgi:lysyl-tRNA synthetase class 2|nr:lysine--tRNA ligase [Pyrinomonadaceae bacterium]
MTIPFFENNDQMQARAQHLEALKDLVGNVYPNKFERSDLTGALSHEDTITSIVETFKKYEPQVNEGEKPSAESLESANAELNKTRVRIAGRIAAPPRKMGKAAFVHLSDGVSRLQIYVRKADVKAVNNSTLSLIEEEGKGWEVFGLLDHGDFIGVEGYLFVTKTGELSVHVEKLQFLAKALLPMPDKMHGINDPEIRQRQRYADLIAGSLKLEPGAGSQEPEQKELSPREVFELRAKVLREIRRFLDERGYIEVETPMLTPLATGAAAKPFSTYHNALGIPLYARIAPELYLKRLTVGGFEKVYELNRNFRNEGISTKHNPEFTMLEYYWAYADVNQMMDLHEEMMRAVVKVATGGSIVRYGAHEIDFERPFQRITMKDAIARFRGEAVDADEQPVRIVELFEEFAEPHLIQPTFITDFPKPVSPLSKASPSDPSVAERFEYFVGALESANGFSELNDPEEQYQRFRDQVQQRERGDEEAMVMDEDYIRALSYGMPPAAGIGVGIDRLVMLLANKHSIRDVILFPHLRPEKKQSD